jgi:hypothetical protein
LRYRSPSATIRSLRTIKSPVFSTVVVTYQERDFYHFVFAGDTRAASGEESAWYEKQFDLFREMYKAREFRLVLFAHRVSYASVGELKHAVAVERAIGGLPPELLISYTPGV